MDDDENKEREKEREREKSVSIFPETPHLLRVFPVKCKRWEDIITLRFISRKENKRETRKRNPPLSPSRRDAREKRVKGGGDC